jgi:hypothetical protein
MTVSKEDLFEGLIEGEIPDSRVLDILCKEPLRDITIDEARMICRDSLLLPVPAAILLQNGIIREVKRVLTPEERVKLVRSPEWEKARKKFGEDMEEHVETHLFHCALCEERARKEHVFK